ncbi:hypothetical protein RMATCC62417_12347 [Rhizopus microsporus]|nr:hypothetical protein RMATCC62417_12347 [Rhizopus microsporus]
MERQRADSNKRIKAIKTNASEQIVQQTAALMECTASEVAGTSSRFVEEPESSNERQRALGDLSSDEEEQRGPMLKKLTSASRNLELSYVKR